MTYRQPDPERSESAAQEREVAGWLERMEAMRGERARPSLRPAVIWLVVFAGPGLGAAAASLLAAFTGIRDRSLLLMMGGLLGFLVAVALVLRLALSRKDGFRP